jgi:hypothetical protein
MTHYFDWCAPHLPIHWLWLRQELVSHMPEWRQLPIHNKGGEETCNTNDCALCESKWECATQIRELLLDNGCGMLDDAPLWAMLDRAR